jgi:hypothetical protein
MQKLNVLQNGFSKEVPSSQNALDIFAGSWWTAMPVGSGLLAGKNPGFEDGRCGWVNDITPLAGKSILELGPFEAYNTWQFAEFKTGDVVSVEANRFNYLKCLVVKEIFWLKSIILHGDFSKYLQDVRHSFDFIWASGVLYHQTDPLRLLELASKRTNSLYLWTYYFDEGCLTSSQQGPSFQANRNSKVTFCGEQFDLSFRSYIDDFENALPLNWSAGTAPFANWLTRADLIRSLNLLGFRDIRIHVDGVRLDDLPVIALLALR